MTKSSIIANGETSEFSRFPTIHYAIFLAHKVNIIATSRCIVSVEAFEAYLETHFVTHKSICADGAICAPSYFSTNRRYRRRVSLIDASANRSDISGAPGPRSETTGPVRHPRIQTAPRFADSCREEADGRSVAPIETCNRSCHVIER